jgi:hypothetical protein
MFDPKTFSRLQISLSSDAVAFCVAALRVSSSSVLELFSTAATAGPDRVAITKKEERNAKWRWDARVAVELCISILNSQFDEIKRMYR